MKLRPNEVVDFGLIKTWIGKLKDGLIPTTLCATKSWGKTSVIVAQPTIKVVFYGNVLAAGILVRQFCRISLILMAQFSFFEHEMLLHQASQLFIGHL